MKQLLNTNKPSLNIIATAIGKCSLFALFPVTSLRFAESSIDVTPLPRVSTDSSEITIILNIVFALIGAICLIIVVIAGFRYVISRGEPQQIARAKDTIIYAIIGLVIAVLGVTIVNFVVGQL